MSVLNKFIKILHHTFLHIVKLTFSINEDCKQKCDVCKLEHLKTITP